MRELQRQVLSLQEAARTAHVAAHSTGRALALERLSAVRQNAPALVRGLDSRDTYIDASRTIYMMVAVAIGVLSKCPDPSGDVNDRSDLTDGNYSISVSLTLSKSIRHSWSRNRKYSSKYCSRQSPLAHNALIGSLSWLAAYSLPNIFLSYVSSPESTKNILHILDFIVDKTFNMLQVLCEPQ